eukprot:m.103181 g.103181  ORF g.103181 m.103181 type:complete len:157 (+) comp15216_c0_seq1:119-589(+)
MSIPNSPMPSTDAARSLLKSLKYLPTDAIVVQRVQRFVDALTAPDRKELFASFHSCCLGNPGVSHALFRPFAEKEHDRSRVSALFSWLAVLEEMEAYTACLLQDSTPEWVEYLQFLRIGIEAETIDSKRRLQESGQPLDIEHESLPGTTGPQLIAV